MCENTWFEMVPLTIGFAWLFWEMSIGARKSVNVLSDTVNVPDCKNSAWSVTSVHV